MLEEKIYSLEELKVKEDSPIWKIVKDFTERWPDAEPQVGISLGKYSAVTTLKEYFEVFGDIIKVRYSKRRGLKGILKRDGRKIRLW
jgi:hypothetical protein